MKKFLIMLCVGVVGGVALAAGTVKVAGEVQATTRDAVGASSFTSSNSLGLSDITHFRVSVCTADVTDMPQNAGSLKAYLLDERTGLVGRDQLLDLDLTSQAQPLHTQCITFPDQTVGVPEGRLLYAASALKLRDGGTLQTQQDGGLDAGFIIYYRGWSSTR